MEELGEGAVAETVDRIQGRERDAVLAGYTVSDPEFALVEAAFLFDARRLNVTVTRARCKLILLLSRRLLEVVPPDEEVFESATQLREYVEGCEEIAFIDLPGPDGQSYPAVIRGRRFLEPAAEIEPEPAMPSALTAAQEQLLAAIRAAVDANNGYAVWASKIRDQLGHYPAESELRDLFQAGWLEMWPRVGKQDSAYASWLARAESVQVFPCDLASARANLATVIATVTTEGYEWAMYAKVRNCFLWFDGACNDHFFPHLESLIAEGLCETKIGAKDTLLVRIKTAAAALLPDATPPISEFDDPPLSDFQLLNALETREKNEINFGVFETAHTVAKIAELGGIGLDESARALARLIQSRYVIEVAEGRYRSRMAEMARLLRYVGQRFKPNDANCKAFLTRSIQVRLLERRKPARNRALAPVFDSLKKSLADAPNIMRVLDGIAGMLMKGWGTLDAAGFQLRALQELLPAYLGRGEHDAFVVTADTGAGKTEAGILPLIAGAALDRLAGKRGVKAVLVYPRIRLAYNQAERITRYLAALARIDPGLHLTIGLQTGSVPTSFPPFDKEMWPWDEARQAYQFPLFRCPPCGAELVLRTGQGQEGDDRLDCTSCKWTFAGWVGSKKRLQQSPPDFFLPVTESLHQWQHNPDCRRLFGDDPAFTAPRAVLADEVHLYTHIAGMQVGYALRRLLARARLNGNPRPLAIGMSATLSNAPAVWSTLCGRPKVRRIEPLEEEREDAPKGREYFYFVQPEIESLGKQIAGESTSIQSLMCLAHNMRRRPGERGGYRGMAFFDSIDSVKRLLTNYFDAEQSRKLASLRTKRYPVHPITKQERDSCCGKPAECDLFRQGECWYFAAGNDPHQVTVKKDGTLTAYRPGQSLRVMPRPVYSGNNDQVDQQIGTNDLIFTTSSLEVGFDDDEMILVYQQYAPLNLASFIQRKGRGGRGIEDRPVTGVTLSIYSPRDAWYFRHPDEMLHPSGFDVPLNAENFFVRRGQAIALLLDFLARAEQLHPYKNPSLDDAKALAKALDENRAAAGAFVEAVLGADVWEELGHKDAPALWRECLKHPRRQAAKTWREMLGWVPERLFDAINLPMLTVKWPKESEYSRDTSDEDIALLFGTCAPGNITRRFGNLDAHWVVPVDQRRAPLMSEPSDYAGALQLELISDAERKQLNHDEARMSEALLARLPAEVRPHFSGKLLYHKLFRPEMVTLKKAGTFAGSDWKPDWFWDRKQRELVHAKDCAGQKLPGVHHKSRSVLLAFPLLTVENGRGMARPIGGLIRLADEFIQFSGGTKQQGTGFKVARAFWGVEVRLRLDDTDVDRESWITVFTNPTGEQPALHGYVLETEGIRLALTAKELDTFLDREREALKLDKKRNRWLRGQFFRYLLATRMAGEGLDSLASSLLADLLIAANDDAALSEDLKKLRAVWDVNSFRKLLQDARAAKLAAHPLLSEERVDGFAESASAKFPALFQRCLSDLTDEGLFRGYLRSLVLHGIALSLHGLFVQHGRGDERQIMLHAQLPVQFAEKAHDIISVFEGGDHGDGTTRTFREHAAEAFASWRRGELAECPYAADDALIEELFADTTRHEEWLALDPKDPETLPRIAQELTGTAALADVHVQALRRVLFDVETAGGAEFRLYHLHAEVRKVQQNLESASDRDNRGPRRPATWELVSAGMQAARDAANYPTIARLLKAYQELTSDHAGDSLAAPARLADQLYRLSASLCPDGCLACLHRTSSLMPDAHTALSVSRDLLRRYREYVLEPLTLLALESVPTQKDVLQCVQDHGLCRVLVSPERFEDWKEQLAALGFQGGEFDPIGRKVVCLRS